MSRHSRSVLFVLAAAFLWGCIGLFSNALSALGFLPLEITSVRLTGAGLLFGLYALPFRPTLFRIRLRHLWCFLGTGICSFVFFNYCYFRCISACSLSVAAILLYTAPCFVLLLSALFFREKLTGRLLLALAVTFAGCVLVTGVGGQQTVSPAALLLGLGSGFGYALYSIFSRAALQRGYTPVAVTLWTLLCGGLGVLPLLDFPHYLTVLPTPGAWLPALGLILLSTIAPILLYTLGLSGLSNGTASLLATLEPVVAALIGVFFFREALTLTQLLGILLVLSAVALLGRKSAPD